MTKDVSRRFVLSIIFTFVLTISIANAQNVAQDIGLKDVEFSSLNKQICQGCHGASLVDTHHKTPKSLSGECVFCHTVSSTPGSMGVMLKRDCMDCHLETPHHTTTAALNNECTACHDSPALNAYSTEVASYPVSKVTPTVANCKECHRSGEGDGFQIVGFEETHHGISIENCDICHEADSEATNIRICERCHNQKVIHEIASHIEAQNCAKCHNI